MSSDVEIGWIAAIIIGGIAGWLAELFMKAILACYEYYSRHRRRGDRQRHSERFWNCVWRPGWISYSLLYRRL